MSEWQGPWRCEKCGYQYPAGSPGGQCRIQEDEDDEKSRCEGHLRPFDRRAPDPRLAALILELRVALGKYHQERDRDLLLKTDAALEAAQKEGET